MRLGTEENRDKKCDWGTRKRPLKSVCRVVRWTSNLPSITFSNFHHYPFLSLLNFRLSLTLKYILLIYFYHIVFIFFWERERDTTHIINCHWRSCTLGGTNPSHGPCMPKIPIIITIASPHVTFQTCSIACHLILY